MPAEIGQLTSLTELCLGDNKLTSVPAEIGQLTSLVKLNLSHNQLTSVPAEIGQLTSLKVLNLNHNQLWSVPAEIGQLTSLKVLNPQATIQLTSLKELPNKRTSGDRAAYVAGEVEPLQQSVRGGAGCDTQTRSGGLLCDSLVG